MKCEHFTVLEQLCNQIAVSGFEHEVTDYYLEYLKHDIPHQYIDNMGNAVAVIEGRNDSPTIMLEAHADEIGFQVLHIADSGFVYIRRNGGIDEQCVPGQQVFIQTRDGNRIPGVIGKKPIHLMNTDDRKRTIEIHQLWVDTGLEPEQVRNCITIGDPVVMVPNIIKLGGYRISSKALDNKLGVYVLMQTMKQLGLQKNMPSTIVGVATVQEEVGSRGAVTAAYSLNPDIAITIDLDFASDVPDCSPSRYGKISLGEGVIIPCNVDCNIGLHQMLVDIATAHNIPYQISARPHATGGTNTSRIQLSRNGVKTISLGIPCRYMHTPVEVCDLRDIDAAIELLVHFCAM